MPQTVERLPADRGVSATIGRRILPCLVAASWALAVFLTWIHLSASLGNQRIIVRWDPSLTDSERTGLEHALALVDGGSGSDQTWNYRVADRSERNLRALVTHPKVIDTGHVDRTRFRVRLDRPDLAPWQVALVETDRVGWFALACGCIALVGTWSFRRRLIDTATAIAARSWVVTRQFLVSGGRVVLPYLPTLVAAFMMFQRRWISEDAFIDLRVVRNLLAGHGPVYNIGERVEAFTNPLWVALLTGYGALGLPLEAGAVYIGFACTIVALVVAQHWSWRLHSRQPGEPHTFALPLGMLVVAALPPVWDFGTSGLETGLTFAWLAWSFALCVRVCELSGPDASRRSTRLTLAAFVAGLGPLIRPDLGIFTIAFALFIAFTVLSVEGARIRGLVRTTTACALVPVAYEVFRMGYYAALVPNTALAKEAGLLFWSRGWLYLRDAVDTYSLWLPLGMLLWVLTAAMRRWRREGRAERAALASAVASAALVHGTYVVAIGGDFMHLRMLLPSIFALALPIGSVAVTRRQAIARRSPWIVEAALVTAVWALLCALYMRPANQGELGAFGITDERSFYASRLNERNPLDVTQYRRFIPAHFLAYAGASETRDRVLDIDGRVVPLTGRMPREIDAALTSTNIGAQGYLVGPAVHVIDRRGLADPIASRLRLDVRSRPGHEKELNDLWILARFAHAPPPDAGSAVEALSCGGLRQILAGIDEPLTVKRFVDNVGIAIAQRSLRVPSDPDEARVTLCGSGG